MPFKMHTLLNVTKRLKGQPQPRASCPLPYSGSDPPAVRRAGAPRILVPMLRVGTQFRNPVALDALRQGHQRQKAPRGVL